MAHTHDHAHDSNYYLDQLCTIATCGALGGVCMMMYFDGRLGYILTPFFFLPVFVGGIALVVMAIVRAITIWREAGEKAAADHHHHHEHVHDHGHVHAHDHEHDHEHHHHHDHEHGPDCSPESDCGHDHGWTPVRYVVLLLPIVLYFLNLPNSTFSAEAYAGMISSSQVEGDASKIANKEGYVNGFKDIIDASYDAKAREAMEGQMGSLKGMFGPSGDDKRPRIYRVKMSCCAADAVPIPIFIVSKENITQFRSKDWVEVQGQVQFHKLNGKFVPVLFLESASQVKAIPPLSDYGLE